MSWCMQHIGYGLYHFCGTSTPCDVLQWYDINKIYKCLSCEVKMSIIIPTVLTEIDRKKQCQQDQCWNESKGKQGLLWPKNDCLGLVFFARLLKQSLRCTEEKRSSIIALQDWLCNEKPSIVTGVTGPLSDWRLNGVVNILNDSGPRIDPRGTPALQRRIRPSSTNIH